MGGMYATTVEEILQELRRITSQQFVGATWNQVDVGIRFRPRAERQRMKEY
jgi:hypothetical protein